MEKKKQLHGSFFLKKRLKTIIEFLKTLPLHTVFLNEDVCVGKKLNLLCKNFWRWKIMIKFDVFHKMV